MPYSPPATPTTTLSPITSGATVMVYPCTGSPTAVCQIGRPVTASSATSCASSVAMNKVSPRMPTPRLIRPQHGLASADGAYSWTQNTRPDRASSATTSLGAWLTYMMPSTTSGVAVKFSSDCAWKTHFSSRSPTFDGVIRSSRLWRVLAYDPE